MRTKGLPLLQPWSHELSYDLSVYNQIDTLLVARILLVIGEGLFYSSAGSTPSPGEWPQKVRTRDGLSTPSMLELSVSFVPAFFPQEYFALLCV